MKRITKLVLPVAGLGKRLHPLTLHTPKNLIRVNGRPLIEYVLEEGIKSGIREVILIVNPTNKRQFEEYIRKNKARFPRLRFHVRVQQTPGGNGHAIIQAHDLLSKEPFAVRFCDDVIVAHPPVLGSMMEYYYKYSAPVLLLERVPKKMVSRFGVVSIKKIKKNERLPAGNFYKITKIVEKPALKDAPSNLTIVGGYIITPNVLRNLKSVVDSLPVVANDALPLTVALQIELIVGGKVYGWEFKGMRLDCGTLEKLQKAEAYLRKEG